MKNKMLGTHKSIIFLNGQMPDFTHYKNIIKGKILIAADGAAKKLVTNKDIKLNYIIGDMDSYINQNINLDDTKVIKINDQNSTDFEKCMDFALQKKLFPSLVLGISGGEIDHTINNIFSLCNHKLPSTHFIEFNTNTTKFGKILCKESFSMNLPLQSKISLIPHPSAQVSSKGLNWELNQCHLKNNGLIGARNWNISEKVEIKVIEGKLLLVTDFIL